MTSVFGTSLRLFLSVLLLCAYILPVEASVQTKKDPNNKKREEELKNVYKKWIDEDVSPIITEDERRAFKALKTDEERDRYIEIFWRLRDPDPDTPENEYKDQYYERVQYANEHFASGVPGWKTDRGRIYIKYGRPDEIEAHPSGGPYDRPSYEGGGTTATYPFEVWWYRNLNGIGSDVEIEFVDPSGSGEYRIARNANEKDANLFVPGAGLTLAEQLGLANKADRVALAGGFGNGVENGPLFVARAKDGEFERLEIIRKLNEPPVRLEAGLKAGLPEITNDVLPVSIRTDFVRLSGESVMTMLTMQVDHREIAFKDEGGIYRGTINLYGRITGVASQVPSVFEDIVQTARYTEAQISAARTQRSLYQKNVILAPGRYKVDVVARDITSGKTGVVHHSFQVPRYGEQLSTSSLVLAGSIQSLSSQTIRTGPFILGSYKVEPYVSGVYKPGQTLATYLQIYNAGMDQATLKPSVEVEYTVSRNGKDLARFSEDGTTRTGAIDLKGLQLIVVGAIPLTGVLGEPGNYSIKVRVTDKVSETTVEPKAQFTVVGRD